MWIGVVLSGNGGAWQGTDPAYRICCLASMASLHMYGKQYIIGKQLIQQPPPYLLAPRALQVGQMTLDFWLGLGMRLFRTVSKDATDFVVEQLKGRCGQHNHLAVKVRCIWGWPGEARAGGTCVIADLQCHCACIQVPPLAYPRRPPCPQGLFLGSILNFHFFKDVQLPAGGGLVDLAVLASPHRSTQCRNHGCGRQIMAADLALGSLLGH